MSESAESQPAAVLPPRTTPTWEMELLVSAGTIIGLLQLPALLDRWHVQLLNGTSEALSHVLSAAWAYCQMSLYTLIATFVLHIFLRGYWVALVGMDSVYPNGIHWDNLRLGPLSRALGRARIRSMAEVIEQADNRATRVFGTGFGAAMILMMPIALAMVALVVAWAMELTFGHRLAAMSFYIVFGTALLPVMVAQGLDRRFGARLAPSGWPARLLTGILRPYQAVAGNLPFSLFLSNEGGRRTALLSAAFFIPVVGFILLSALASRGQLNIGNDTGWPKADPYDGRSVVTGFYASVRGEPGAGKPLPYISDRVVAGPYLPLFVPFIPRMHAHAMAKACPRVMAASDAISAANLDCLARLSEIRIDGKPVSVRFEASTDPRSGQRGMFAMLPIDGLPRGRHELSLAAPVRLGQKAERYRIPFWR